MDHPGIHPQDTGKLQLVPECILRACIHRQRTVGLWNGHTRFGLQRRMGLTWRPVFMLDDEVRFTESLLHVALRDEGVQADVALVMDLGGIRLQRFDGVVDDRQDFVVHLDQSRRLFGDAFGRGSHQRHSISHIPHLVAANDRHVGIDDPEPVEPGHVCRRQYRDDTVQRHRLADIDAFDQGMRVLAAHKPCKQHPRK